MPFGGTTFDALRASRREGHLSEEGGGREGDQVRVSKVNRHDPFHTALSALSVLRNCAKSFVNDLQRCAVNIEAIDFRSGSGNVSFARQWFRATENLFF